MAALPDRRPAQSKPSTVTRDALARSIFSAGGTVQRFTWEQAHEAHRQIFLRQADYLLTVYAIHRLEGGVS